MRNHPLCLQIIKMMLFNLKCNFYTKIFNRYYSKLLPNKVFCSVFCRTKSQENFQIKLCKNCNLPTKKNLSQIIKNKNDNFFCNRSCSVTYHNTHKQKGFKRSKLEKWIESQLIILYPKLLFKFNEKEKN